MAWVLQASGNPVHISSEFVSEAHPWSGYETSTRWAWQSPDGRVDPRQLANSVKLLDPHVDLFHVHNEPNWMFRIVKENTDKPVVFDIHDWTSLRRAAPGCDFEIEEERFALDHADAFVVPSEGYLKRIRAYSTKPSTLIYSMVPKDFFPRGGPKVNSLTYEGGLKGKNIEFIYNFPYRNWSDAAKKLVEMGLEIDFYTANGGEDYGDYPKDKVRIHDPLHYPELFSALSQHRAGLVGSPVPLLDFEDSMPNKLFEYLAAGIPCIVWNAPEAARYVERHGVGVGIQNIDEVPEALEKLKDCNVPLERWHFTMEGQIPALLGCYEEILACRAPRVIPQMGV